ncbi:MAG: adenylate kinase [Gemmatimonadales bacterium]|nr:adenylate kinase [Gemmatimonadales bacterium]
MQDATQCSFPPTEIRKAAKPFLARHRLPRDPRKEISVARNIVFLGPQGSGKGTVIGKIKNKYHVPHISTGDMFREAVKQGTEFGKKAQESMNRGELVPDDVTCGMVRERIGRDDCVEGFMLDGFPRNLSQAEALSGIANIDTAVLLDVPEHVSLERLSGRRQCRECSTIFHLKFVPPKKDGICDKCGGELYQRDDDRPEAIKERLAVYHAETTPIVDYYEKAGVLVKVDGSGTVDEVVAQIIERLD